MEVAVRWVMVAGIWAIKQVKEDNFIYTSCQNYTTKIIIFTPPKLSYFKCSRIKTCKALSVELLFSPKLYWNAFALGPQ